MLSVEEARARILSALQPVSVERIGLEAASGRVLAETLTARRTQPPLAVSAMDGYALRAEDLAAGGTRFRVVASIAAGARHETPLTANDAARIFTGAPLPPGADTVVIQEEVTAEGDDISLSEAGARTAPGANVRRAGIDFAAGAELLAAGTVLTPRALALAAAGDRTEVSVSRRPRIGVLATGDELTRPGQPRRPQDIIASSLPGLLAATENWGGEAVELGIAADTPESLAAALAPADRLDLVVTLGGASVGDHDLIAQALPGRALAVDFWKIAMRPGKPLLFGKLGATPLLGLPGNPVSALVCALLFLRPALARLAGAPPPHEPWQTMSLGEPLGPNGPRAHYMRAQLVTGDNDSPCVVACADQDSSLLSVLARAEALIRRPPDAPALAAGEPVEVLPLAGLL